MRGDADSNILRHIFVIETMKKLKIDIFIWNFHYLYYQKYRFDAQCRCPHAPEVVFKTYLSQLFKQFHNHMGARRRRQYHFETYFGHKDYETGINWNFHVKFSSSEFCKTTKEKRLWSSVLMRNLWNFYSTRQILDKFEGVDKQILNSLDFAYISTRNFWGKK